MQAIVTSYMNDDRHRAVIVAQCQGKQVRLPYDSALSLDDNHVGAALRLAQALGWQFDWAFARLPLGDYAHVPVRGVQAYSTREAPSETTPAEYWRGRGAGSLPASRRR